MSEVGIHQEQLLSSAVTGAVESAEHMKWKRNLSVQPQNFQWIPINTYYRRYIWSFNIEQYLFKHANTDML